MADTCKKDGCYANIECPLGEPFKEDCEYYTGNQPEQSISNGFVTEKSAHLLSWSGNSMGMDDLKIVAERSSPLLISLMGAPNSGKTTFLGLLYLLLSDGRQLEKHRFSNSYTLMGWEYIANFMRYEGGSKSGFPPHTSSYGGRDVGLLHLGLKNNKKLTDILLTDVPGEWFKNWSVDEKDVNAGKAGWIDENATGVILFLDSEGLSSPTEYGKYRISTLKLIRRLANNIGTRKVAVVWSKADLKKKINAPISKIIQKEIENKLPNHKIFDISVQHGAKNEYHNNILSVLNWLIEKKEVQHEREIQLCSADSNDYLFRYRKA